MEDDIDIYQDLSNFGSNFIECGSSNHPESEEKITELTKQLENEKQKNVNLKANISALLKTAKTEIARKDRTINELRESLNNFQFRRVHKQKIPKINEPVLVEPVEETDSKWNLEDSEWNLQDSKSTVHLEPIRHESLQHIAAPISTLYTQRWQEKIKNENLSNNCLTLKKEPKEESNPINDDPVYDNEKFHYENETFQMRYHPKETDEYNKDNHYFNSHRKRHNSETTESNKSKHYKHNYPESSSNYYQRRSVSRKQSRSGSRSPNYKSSRYREYSSRDSRYTTYHGERSQNRSYSKDRKRYDHGTNFEKSRNRTNEYSTSRRDLRIHLNRHKNDQLIKVERNHKNDGKSKNSESTMKEEEKKKDEAKTLKSCMDSSKTNKHSICPLIACADSSEDQISLHLSVNLSHRCTSPGAGKCNSKLSESPLKQLNSVQGKSHHIDSQFNCKDEKLPIDPTQVIVKEEIIPLNGKKIVTARRRRPIKLTDSNASMIIVVDNEIL